MTGDLFKIRSRARMAACYSTLRKESKQGNNRRSIDNANAYNPGADRRGYLDQEHA